MMKSLMTSFNFSSNEQRAEFKKQCGLLEAGIQDIAQQLVEEFNTNPILRKRVAKRLAERDGLTNNNGEKKEK